MKYRMGIIGLCMLALVFAAGVVPAVASTAAGDDEHAVTIRRDVWGVPHVYADTVYGLFYGYGYAVAHDRLFQMAMAKRSAEGRVAAVLGADYVAFDRKIRRGYSAASIRAQIEALPPQDRAILEGYAAGMNAWIEKVRAQPDKLMPLQFIEFGFQPEPWTAFDVAMIFVGSMANRFGDFNTEIQNQQLLNALVAAHGRRAGHAIFNQLLPLRSPDAPTTVPLADWRNGQPTAQQRQVRAPVVPISQGARLRLAGLTKPGHAFSNIVLLGEKRSEDANAILLNGPQFGWYQPAYTYSIGLHGAGYNVVGNTPFAYPAILFGHNGEIAWGSTWAAGDVVDIYRETLNPDNPNEYLYKGEYRKMDTRTEIIKVRGAEPVKMVVRSTVHGPVIAMDKKNGYAYTKKRSWAGREIQSLMAWVHSMQAQNFEQWLQYAAREALNINWYYADTQGNIGYAFTGAYPIRAPGDDKRLPTDGRGHMEWQGIHDFFDYNPWVLNPSSGYIANWNNKPADGPYAPDEWWYSWSSADRVAEITSRIEAAGTLDADELWDLMAEVSRADVNARHFIPLLVEAAAGLPADDPRRELVALMSQWNGLLVDRNKDGYYDGAAPMVFRVWLTALVDRVLGDDIPVPYFGWFASPGYATPASPMTSSANLQVGVKTVYEALTTAHVDSARHYDLLNGATADAVMLAALTTARQQLRERFGNDRQQWRVRVVPQVFFTRNFWGIPQALEREEIRTPLAFNRGTENDLIKLTADGVLAWEVTAPGQSGFIGPNGVPSPHYADQVVMYAHWGRKRTWLDIDAVKKHTVDVNVIHYQRSDAGMYKQ